MWKNRVTLKQCHVLLKPIVFKWSHCQLASRLGQVLSCVLFLFALRILQHMHATISTIFSSTTRDGQFDLLDNMCHQTHISLPRAISLHTCVEIRSDSRVRRVSEDSESWVTYSTWVFQLTTPLVVSVYEWPGGCSLLLLSACLPYPFHLSALGCLLPPCRSIQCSFWGWNQELLLSSMLGFVRISASLLHSLEEQ